MAGISAKELEYRKSMVEVLRSRGIRDESILAAFTEVRRHLHIPDGLTSMRGAYGDHPCSIGQGQTISQPFIVAYMIELLEVEPGDKVLEIGAGCGYQAAILAELGARVYAVEIVPELADYARNILNDQGYRDVEVVTTDGYQGLPSQAPFDGIIGGCAPDDVPDALIDQLGENAKLVMPVGRESQQIAVVHRIKGRTKRRDDIAVRFVPMIHGES